MQKTLSARLGIYSVKNVHTKMAQTYRCDIQDENEKCFGFSFFSIDLRCKVKRFLHLNAINIENIFSRYKQMLKKYIVGTALLQTSRSHNQAYVISFTISTYDDTILCNKFYKRHFSHGFVIGTSGARCILYFF